MLATFCLLGLTLGVSQTARPQQVTAGPRADWASAPRLTRGQELTYRGTYTEQAGSRVQFARKQRFEARAFVLEATGRGTELAVLSLLSDKPASTVTVRDASVTAARLERVRLDNDGKATAGTEVSLEVPLEGPPPLEVGMFLELPRPRPTVGQGWQTVEAGRPAINWEVVATESVSGQSCLKIVGTQQTDDWERPRADRAAWRRVETVWVSPRTAIASRVERVIDHREPARREIARTIALRYELDSDMTFPSRLADDRRQEIQQLFTLREASAAALAEPVKNAKQIPTLQKRVAAHLDGRPPTAYREAALALRRQLEAAARGEQVVRVSYEPRPTVRTTQVGQTAPDFLATDMTGPGSGRLSAHRGKAVLLVFYSPTSPSAAEVLRFAQQMQTSLAGKVQVLGLSVSDDSAAVLQQRAALGVKFPVLHGSGMRLSYGVDSTPRLVVVDAEGVLRAAVSGWSGGTGDEITAELRKCLPDAGR